MNSDQSETTDRNCLSFWYPKLAEYRALALPVPKTTIVTTDHDLTGLLDGEEPKGWGDFMGRLEAAVVQMGTPCFLRTGHGSDKHDWVNTCYVGSQDDLAAHVASLVEWSALVDLMGLPTRVWAVRQLIATEPLFHAFTGHMPITREFRFFVRDAAVEHRQPYWPPDSIYMPTTEDWAYRLGRAAMLAPSTQQWLEWLAVCAVGAVGGGYWSVDLLQDREGKWWITDMAEGERSFRWDPDAPREERPDAEEKYAERLGGK